MKRAIVVLAGVAVIKVLWSMSLIEGRDVIIGAVAGLLGLFFYRMFRRNHEKHKDPL